MGTSSERVSNGSEKGYLPAGTIGNRTHILSERLKAGTEFKRLKKGHRPVPIPAGALVPDQDKQRDRAHQPRDREEDEGRRDLPRRQLGPHAGDGEAEVHSGARVGQEEVPGHVQAGGDGRAEGKGEGLEKDGADDG